VRLSAEIRMERDPKLTLVQAMMSVIGDCLIRNGDVTYRPERPLLDWNWRRVAAVKAAHQQSTAGLPAVSKGPELIDTLIEALRAEIAREFGGDWSVRITSDGEQDYRWGRAEAA
jgi:hypothetical protein